MLPIKHKHTLSRREILTKVLPSCTLMCASGSALVWASPNIEKQESVHKFQKMLDRKFSVDRLFSYRYRMDFIPTLQMLEEKKSL